MIVAVRQCAWPQLTGHAVHNSIGKTYSYHLALEGPPSPFQAPWCWHPPFAVNRSLLEDVSRDLLGSWNMQAFKRRGEWRDHFQVQIQELSWSHQDGMSICSIQGDRFTYRLIRSLIGACLAVASGAAKHRDLQAALQGNKSPATDHQAPAQGLCLDQVHYTRDPFLGRSY